MDPQLSAEEVRRQLESILVSDGFRDAGRLGPFLKYVVEAALNGQPVKEAVLGSEVFARAAGYDPKSDPIVRVEARRLRQRLEAYYDKNPDDAVRIDLPKGGYVPSFHRKSADATATMDAPRRAYGGRIAVVAILIAIASGIGWLFWARGRAMERPIPAVAVLPFRNVSADPDNNYFSDGLTIELIDALTKVEKLKVVSWKVAEQFRGKAGSLEELRSQLQAGAVLDGTVRKDRDRLRITATLVDTMNGETIWSDTYERQARDIFRIQEEIAKSIVYSLKVQLRVDPQRLLVPQRTDSPQAFEDYLRARYFRNQFSREGLANSNKYAQQAIAGDPNYAPAYALLAMNTILSGYYKVIPMDEAAQKSKELARKAIAIDPSSNEAHAALGTALAFGDWDWKGAHDELQRAAQWSPGSPDAHAAFALAYLMPLGMLEEAEFESKKALSLDPLSLFATYQTGYVLLARGKNAEAISRLETALSIYQNFPDLHWDYGMALAAVGRSKEAESEFLKTCELEGNTGCRLSCVGAALLGRSDEARKILDENSDRSRPIERARAWALLKNLDQAFLELNRAIDQRDPQVIFIQADPRLSNLRGDRRYAAILKRMGFAE